MQETELITQINEAFPKQPIPTDDEIVYDNSGFYLDVEEFRNDLKGNAWDTLPLTVVIHHRDDLPFLSPKGFAYYLPLFLQAVVQHPAKTDSLEENLVFLLGKKEDSWRNRCLESLNMEQREVLKRVLELHRQRMLSTEPEEYIQEITLTIESI
ncbi:MAG: hypothetical protein KF726_17055 [Anaerolineae bacterium]|nr:hypothetical protein [Anaerolineae bacterium]